MYEHTYPDKRFRLTTAFVKKHIPVSRHILDLGITNPLAEIMRREGYNVTNTRGEDLDTDHSALQQSQYDVVTAFEIFEHLLNPFTVLQNITAKALVVSVPLRLWFAPAYRSKTDLRDRHYHEFEDWQFDWLLEKTGWKIVDRVYFTNPVSKLGIRPLLRRFTPRYYLVYAVKNESCSDTQ